MSRRNDKIFALSIRSPYVRPVSVLTRSLWRKNRVSGVIRGCLFGRSRPGISRALWFRLPPQDSEAATNGADKRVYAVHGEGHGDRSRLDSGSSCLSGVALPW